MWHSRDLRSVRNLASQTPRTEYRHTRIPREYSLWRLRQFRVQTTPAPIGVTRARLSCFRDSRAWRVTVASWRLRDIPCAGTSRSHRDIVATRVAVTIVRRYSYSVPYRLFINKLFIARLSCASRRVFHAWRCRTNRPTFQEVVSFPAFLPTTSACTWRDSGSTLNEGTPLYFVRCGRWAILGKCILVADKIVAVWERG